MSLYGHEISEEINVFEAGLARWLKLDKGDFIGRDALLAVQAAGGPKRKIVGLEMVERGIARDSYPVLSLEGEAIGLVTSGLAGAVFEDQHRDGACSHSRCRFRQPTLIVECAAIACARDRFRFRFTSGRKNSPQISALSLQFCARNCPIFVSQRPR